MEVGRNERQMECARRSLQAAFAHLDYGDFATAGALFRAAGRYVEGIGEGKAHDAGAVVAFPCAHALTQGAQEVAHVWG
jgi:hypothetical protein